MEKIVGHKTFINPDGTFRHEPLGESEALAMLDSLEAERAKREADMPTERDAINAMWEAWYRLKELGWKDAQYLEGVGDEVVDVIEIGSTGIHRTAYPGGMAVLYRKAST